MFDQPVYAGQFGTDYSMIYFDAFAGLDQYYRNFRDSSNTGAFTIAERMRQREEVGLLIGTHAGDCGLHDQNP